MFVVNALLLGIPVPPKISPLNFGEDVFQEGESATLQCTASHGDLPIKLTWKFNNQPLSDDKLGVSVSSMGKRVSVLMIEPVSAFHMGNYSCIAQNKAGVVAETTELAVNGVNR